ncbi:MAG TPA: lysylphosphatidylglycerol synthase domain-containing protein [Thermoanaerobaculia bacterium]|nr:lysylphosphatidylglycerol synthase domain-containing protein [Thermoanaerobaculia bacterium]
MSARETLAAAARRGLPWLVGLAILAVLVREIRLEPLLDAFRHGAYLALAAYIVLETLLALPADAFGARAALAAAGVRRPFLEVLQARGASYLLGLISYFAGQGGIGWYLARTGVPVGRSAGAVLLLMITNGMVMIVLGAAGLGAALAGGALGGAPRELLFLTIVAALAGTVLYWILLAVRPRWLSRYSLLAPLFEAGVAGNLRAFAARLPHMLLLTILHWGAFRVWGIAVPVERGVALNPVVLLIAALPIAPGGLGTTQALQVLFFSPWAMGSTPDSRAAAVLAFSLVHHVFGLIVQGAIGLACLLPLRRALRAEP